MRLFHGGPLNYPCEADATGQGAPHGVKWDNSVVSILLTTFYAQLVAGRNATFAARFQCVQSDSSGGTGWSEAPRTGWFVQASAMSAELI